MSSFANTSFSTAAKEGANNSAKSSSTLIGNNVGSGGAGRGTEGGGMAVGEWPARVNGNSTASNNPTTPTPLASRSSTGPRRPSLSTTLSHHPNHHSHNFMSSPLTPSASSTSLNSNTNPSLYHPPHHYNSQTGGGGGNNSGVNGPRSYSREEMLNIFKSMPSGALEKGLQDLMKRATDTEGGGGKEILAEVCWVDSGVTLGPVALEDMTAEEKELFSGSVNSPQKQPPPIQGNQNNNNPNPTSSGNSRKNTGTMGINTNNSLGSNSGSPASLRNQNARRNTRDTSDNSGPHTNQPPSSPATREHSQQSHSSLSRRRTDLRGSVADTFGGDLEKDPTANEKKEGGSNSRPNFGRWGSITTSNTSGDRHDNDHHDVPTPTSATVGRSIGLFRRSSAGWGNSSIGSAGGLALGVGLGGSGAAAFNNGTFGGSAGFALSGGVPSSSASNSGDKRLGSKSGSIKGESSGFGEKSSASSIKSNSGEHDAEKDGESDKRPLSKSEGAAEDDKFQRLHESTFQNILKEEDEENDSFEPDMGQSSQRFHFYQDQRGKENNTQHEERPMSSDTDPYGRRDSLIGYLHEDNIGSQHPQAHASIAAAIGAEQARLKATSPFSGAGSSVTTPTRNRTDLGFGARDFGGGGGLGNLHTQLRDLRDLNINQQGGVQGSRLLGSSTSQECSGEHEPLSPTETNPYQSPAPEKEDDSNLGSSMFHDDDSGFVGIGGVLGSGSLRRSGVVGEGGPGSDRSGRSSAAGLGSALGGPIGGLNSLGMGDIGTPGGGLWGTGSGVLPINTPSRLGGVNAGPGSFFSTLGTESSSLGGSTLLGPTGQGTGLGSVSRASKLGALFMEPEFQQQQQHQHLGNEGGLEGNDTFDGFRLGGGGGSVGVNSGRRLFGMSGGLGGAESPLRGNDVNDLFNVQGGGRGVLGSGVGDGSVFSQMGGENHHGVIQGLHNFSQPTPPIRPPNQPVPGLAQTAGPNHQTALIMPDKIQWEYRDPQGVIQGPFSGLEMHDWFKGGYFPQDLHVKRVEDPEFEPLSQLIRRIGNQREPFLVPLQGATQGGPSWGPASWSDNPNQPPGTVQPPFANSFPTFGTTLTADQQNALEYRKQEEQFLIARQREYLVQVQFKQAQAIQQHQLHHIHPQPSLGGLPAPIGAGAVGLGGIGAFNSVGAVGPIGGGNVGSIGSSVAIPGLQPGHHSFEPGVLLRQAASVIETFPSGRLDDVLQQGTNQGNMIPRAIQQPSIPATVYGQQQPPNPVQIQHMQQAQQAFQLQQQVILDRQRQQVVERQQQEKEELEAHQPQQAQVETSPVQSEQNGEEENVDEAVSPAQEQVTQSQPSVQHVNPVWGNSQPSTAKAKSPPPAPTHIDTNIHEQAPPQAKKAATPKATSPAPQLKKLSATSSPWQQTQNELSPMPAPFPPPPSVVNKAGDSPSIGVSGANRGSPVDPPHFNSTPIAPWLKKTEESSVSKGPSLKEIQEMEAKAAALEGAIAEQARKDAALQQSNAATQPIVAQPIGLPSSAVWASGSPTTTPGNTPSAWGGVKPLTKSASLPIQTGPPKKTLQQIQKEEEAKKAKSAQQAAAAQAASALAALGAQTVTTPGGKRYADLAGKQPTAGPGGGTAPAGGAWTTVGAGGKIKTPGGASTPTTPAASTAPVLKSINSTGVMGSFGKIAVVKQHPSLTSTGTNTSPAPSTPTPQPSTLKTPAMLAQDEFMKWCRISLKQLNSNVNQEEFLQSLLSFPPETDLIADSVYANSSTMDGNRFAEEFVRRRKSAQQGVVVEAGSTGNSSSSGGGGGWNEVAAKAGRSNNTAGTGAGGPMAEPVGFKVVPGKKKGRK